MQVLQQRWPNMQRWRVSGCGKTCFLLSLCYLSVCWFCFRCSFHNLKEELDEGHCVGGGCKIHDGSSMMEVGIEEAIVNKKAAAPEPEPEPAVATPATVVEEAAAPAVEKSEEEPAAAAEAPAELAEAEAKPEELGEEKKSRFARYNKRT